ncbi:MAG TPA: site-2 protease family protein [Firmicutes bacterium]|nr:site-2 protease family protein [Bacillota bacterium]
MNLVVAFVLVLGPTIFFHELGHFLAAKAVGVKVYEFALGFGPALLRRRGRDTVYSLRLLPLGGFVKLAGMDIPEDEDAIIPDEDESSFNKKSLSQRLAVIAAGPIMNFVLAVVLFAVYMGLVFIPPTVQVVEPGSPAAEVGLLPGDVITEVAGEKIASIREINSIVARHPDQEIPITILRENRPLRLTITPRLDRELGRARLGIGMVEKERQSPGQALYTGLRQTYFVSRDIVLSIVRMIAGRIEPDIAGPIGIFQIVGESANRGLMFVVFMAAVLSINLGLFNFLPIPVLDGGWLVMLLWEAARGRPLEPEQKGLVQFIGLAFLLLLMLFATYKDLARLSVL